MRIKPQDITPSNQTPFQTHHEVRTEYDLEALLKDETALLDVRSNLRVGDRVTFCQYRKIDKQGAHMEGLVGFVSVRITEIDAKHVAVMPEADVVKVKPYVPEEVNNSDNGLEVKRVMPTADGLPFAAVDSNGNEVERFKTKREAEAFAGVSAVA